MKRDCFDMNICRYNKTCEKAQESKKRKVRMWEMAS